MNVILTAIGSMSALCVINKLHYAGHKVIGCDIYPKEWHYEASICDVFQQAPYANTKEYIPFLIKLAKKNNANFIMPLTDLEIDVIRKNRNLLENEGLTVCVSSNDTLAIVRNKMSLYNVFKDDEKLPSLQTYKCNDDLSNLKYPCLAKPIFGRSSEGISYIENSDQLEYFKNKDKYILQEKIEGRVCTIDYVRDPITNNTFCVPREELLRTKNGAGTTVKIFHNEKLENIVNYIGEKLNIKGVVNMEFINNENGYFLIDINPRFSAGIAFSCNIGYDFINSHLACFSEGKISKPVEFSECIEIKYFIEK